MPTNFKLKNTIKYPTSLIINGASNLGLEIAESLLEQGGYIVIVDTYSEANVAKITNKLGENMLVSFLDYSAIPHLEEDIRRLDYVFYLGHTVSHPEHQISTQNFLKYSNYLDSTLALSAQFEAKFLLTTSVKAHQMLLASMDMEVNFGKDAKSPHTVYTDMEVQRYAESLSLEYVNKTTLDARIIRIGEVIGEGMDLGEDTAFAHLVLSAVTGNNLELSNDGLEADYYVHLLDGAYGLIKAQFSLDTKGKIYSLAYENSVTHLSLAYKIQELEPQAREISFVNEQSNLSPLRLHKPAPNLSQIGWKTKIDFESALSESLAMAKLFVVQQQVKSDIASPADTSVVNKIRSFLNIAKAEGVEVKVDADASGPISRLIAERRMAEESRDASLSNADKAIKYKRNARNLSFKDRFNGWLWQNIFDTRTNFPFLRRITPLQFLVYIIFGGLTIYLYFVLIAPAIVIGRNIYVLSNSLTALKQSMQNQNFSDVYTNSGSIEAALKESSTLLSRYQGVAKLVAVDSYLNSGLALLQSYASYAEGIKQIAYSLDPLSQYLHKYTNNTNFRPDTASYLAVSDSTDYSLILQDLVERKAYAEIGENLLTQSRLELGGKSANLPSFLLGPLTDFSTKLISNDELTNYVDFAKYTPQLLGMNTPTTYLVVLVDNSKPMPLGGSISAFALLTVKNGSLIDTKVQSIDAFTPALDKLSPFVLDEINLHTFSDKSLSTLKISDLGYIGNIETFSAVAKDLWGKSLGRSIDMVSVINTESLGSMIGNKPIEMDRQSITGDNLLSALKSLQAENETSIRRNDVLAQLLAKFLNNTFADYQANFYNVVKLLASSATSKNLIVAKSDLEFNNVVESNKLYGDLVNSSDMPVYTYLVSDPKVISPINFPALNEAYHINVNADSSLTYQLNVKFPAVTNMDQIAICIALGTKDLTVSGIPTLRYKTKTAAGNKCVIADTIGETEISLSWNTIQFESSQEKEYNFTLGNAKTSGAKIESFVEVTLSPTLSFAKINPPVSINGGKIDFSESLTKDQIIELVINKN